MNHQESIDHALHTHLPALRQFHSTKSLKKSSLYRTLQSQIEKVLSTYELKQNPAVTAAPEPYYRCVAWNIERGMRFEAILHCLKNHPILSTADILLLTETDLGMARSGNRHVTAEIATELKLHYYFAPSYLNLAKGCGIEREAEGENKIGIAGNSILSRYPIIDPEVVPLINAHDKMRGREKRLGNQMVPVATIDLAGRPLTVAAIHLDVRSTQRHRRRQLQSVIDAIQKRTGGPALVGGDWNTSTYDAHSALSSIIGFWIRVFSGTHNMIRNHYPYPEKFFERKLFQMLEERGFNFRTCNQLGVGTSHYSVEDIKQFKNLKEWLPQWCFRFIEWSLKEHDGRCSFKLDWFSERGLTVLKEQESQSSRKGASIVPTVVGKLSYDNYPPSDHDPIVVDFTIPPLPPHP